MYIFLKFLLVIHVSKGFTLNAYTKKLFETTDRFTRINDKLTTLLNSRTHALDQLQNVLEISINSGRNDVILNRTCLAQYLNQIDLNHDDVFEECHLIRIYRNTFPNITGCYEFLYNWVMDEDLLELTNNTRLHFIQNVIEVCDLSLKKGVFELEAAYGCVTVKLFERQLFIRTAQREIERCYQTQRQTMTYRYLTLIEQKRLDYQAINATQMKRIQAKVHDLYKARNTLIQLVVETNITECRTDWIINVLMYYVNDTIYADLAVLKVCNLNHQIKRINDLFATTTTTDSDLNQLVLYCGDVEIALRHFYDNTVCVLNHFALETNRIQTAQQWYNQCRQNRTQTTL